MEQSQKFIEAKKRVDAIKGFYHHLTAYIIVNLALIFIRVPVILFFADKGGDAATVEVVDWLDWNIVLTPVLWGIGLLIHGLVVFGKNSGYIRKWEERKIQEILREEDEKSRNLYQ
ncbi:MAG: 2TM domain-containing protein [Eudoraea sp.]|nr:2TM domain-containing protein [Eudoraea sp.]